MYDLYEIDLSGRYYILVSLQSNASVVLQVSAYTPGLEAAALSGLELADHLYRNVVMHPGDV